MDNHEPDMDKIGIDIRYRSNLQHPATKLMELFLSPSIWLLSILNLDFSLQFQATHFL